MNFLVLVSDRLHENVADKAERKTVGNRRSHRHHDDREEGRETVGEVLEIDLLDAAHHHGADKDQSGRGRKRRHQSDQRRKQQ